GESIALQDWCGAGQEVSQPVVEGDRTSAGRNGFLHSQHADKFRNRDRDKAGARERYHMGIEFHWCHRIGAIAAGEGVVDAMVEQNWYRLSHIVTHCLALWMLDLQRDQLWDWQF